jgi:hypothetical protein
VIRSLCILVSRQPIVNRQTAMGLHFSRFRFDIVSTTREKMWCLRILAEMT